MKAIWENAVLAESDKTIVVEGNHYFPSDSIVRFEVFLICAAHLGYITSHVPILGSM